MLKHEKLALDIEHPNIRKLHFLIHPGYLSRGINHPDDQKEYESLLDKYVDEAKKLRDDELMFALISPSRVLVKKELAENAPYLEKIKEIKSILGPRLIVLHFQVLENSSEAMDTATRIAAARGFHFDKDVLSDAYGELLGACVKIGAANLNRDAGFINKMVLRPELSDESLPRGKSKKIRLWGEDHERFVFIPRTWEDTPITGRTFENYCDDLKIKPEDLSGKIILDIGAGTRRFAKGMKDANINARVFSLDPRFVLPAEERFKELEKHWGEASEIAKYSDIPEINKKTIAALGEELPLRDNSLDMIVADNTLPGYLDTTEQIDSFFLEAFRVLREGGELRFYPSYAMNSDAGLEHVNFLDKYI